MKRIPPPPPPNKKVVPQPSSQQQKSNKNNSNQIAKSFQKQEVKPLEQISASEPIKKQQIIENETAAVKILEKKLPQKRIPPPNIPRIIPKSNVPIASNNNLPNLTETNQKIQNKLELPQKLQLVNKQIEQKVTSSQKKESQIKDSTFEKSTGITSQLPIKNQQVIKKVPPPPPSKVKTLPPTLIQKNEKPSSSNLIESEITNASQKTMQERHKIINIQQTSNKIEDKISKQQQQLEKEKQKKIVENQKKPAQKRVTPPPLKKNQKKDSPPSILLSQNISPSKKNDQLQNKTVQYHTKIQMIQQITKNEQKGSQVFLKQQQISYVQGKLLQNKTFRQQPISKDKNVDLRDVKPNFIKTDFIQGNPKTIKNIQTTKQKKINISQQKFIAPIQQKMTTVSNNQLQQKYSEFLKAKKKFQQSSEDQVQESPQSSNDFQKEVIEKQIKQEYLIQMKLPFKQSIQPEILLYTQEKYQSPLNDIRSINPIINIISQSPQSQQIQIQLQSKHQIYQQQEKYDELKKYSQNAYQEEQKTEQKNSINQQQLKQVRVPLEYQQSAFIFTPSIFVPQSEKISRNKQEYKQVQKDIQSSENLKIHTNHNIIRLQSNFSDLNQKVKNLTEKYKIIKQQSEQNFRMLQSRQSQYINRILILKKLIIEKDNLISQILIQN